MARDSKITVATANVVADAYARLLDGGKIRVYSGDIPATAATAITTQILAAEFTLTNPSAPAASNGSIALNEVQPATGLATVEATFFRVLTLTGAVIIQDTVGDADLGAPQEPFGLVLTTRFIVQNAIVPLNYFILTPLLDE